MKRAYSLLLLIILTACSGQHQKLNRIIENATNVEVFVFDKGLGQNGVMAYESSDPARIKEFKNYFTNKHSPQYKNRISGKIVFSSGKKDLNVLFNLDPDCTHIAYMIDYNLYTMKLSEKGLAFLKTVTANLPEKPIQQNKVSSSEETN
jgi:hypothetical protein